MNIIHYSNSFHHIISFGLFGHAPGFHHLSDYLFQNPPPKLSFSGKK
ncbi:MAG: hypothetical protein WCR95_07500 [Eubacteriales bacterium]